MARSKEYARYIEEKPKALPQDRPAGHDAPFRAYVNVNLDSDQKADYDAWSQGDALWVALERETTQGVHLALRLDPKGNGFLASGTQRDPQSPNAGLVVTARGRSASIAWGRLLFILDLLARKPRWEDTQPLSDPDRW